MMLNNDNSDILHNGGLEGLEDYKIFRRRYPSRSSLPVRLLTEWWVDEISVTGKRSPKWIRLCGIHNETVIMTSPVTSIITSRKICTWNCIYELGHTTKVLEKPVRGIERYFADGFPNNWESIVEAAFCNEGRMVDKATERVDDRTVDDKILNEVTLETANILKQNTDSKETLEDRERDLLQEYIDQDYEDLPPEENTMHVLEDNSDVTWCSTAKNSRIYIAEEPLEREVNRRLTEDKSRISMNESKETGQGYVDEQALDQTVVESVDNKQVTETPQVQALDQAVVEEVDNKQIIDEIGSILSNTPTLTLGIDDEFESYDGSLLKEGGDLPRRRSVRARRENKYMSVADFVHMTSPFKVPSNIISKKPASLSHSSNLTETQRVGEAVITDETAYRPVEAPASDIGAALAEKIPNTEISPSPEKEIVDCSGDHRGVFDQTLTEDSPVKKLKLDAKNRFLRTSLDTNCSINTTNCSDSEKICDDYFERIKTTHSASPVKVEEEQSEDSMESVFGNKAEIDTENIPVDNNIADLTDIINEPIINSITYPATDIINESFAGLINEPITNSITYPATDNITDPTDNPIINEPTIEPRLRDVMNLSDISSSTKSDMSFKRPSIKVLKPKAKADDRGSVPIDESSMCSYLELHNNKITENRPEESNHPDESSDKDENIIRRNSISHIRRKSENSIVDEDAAVEAENYQIQVLPIAKRRSLSANSGIKSLPVKNISSLDSNICTADQESNRSFTKSKKKKTILVMPKRLKNLSGKLKKK